MAVLPVPVVLSPQVPRVAGDGAVGVGRAGRVDGQAQVLVAVVNAAVGRHVGGGGGDGLGGGVFGAAVVGDGQRNLVGAGGRVGVAGGLAGAGGAVAPGPRVAGDGAVGVGRARTASTARLRSVVVG